MRTRTTVITGLALAALAGCGGGGGGSGGGSKGGGPPIAADLGQAALVAKIPPDGGILRLRLDRVP